ncbi:transmembrane protein 183 [Phlebotomus argentipes]|uniref:transmembrane protein 183 n=1 Tax=Phlebotomus argentipes TaxID=94469 RepID=UPI0028932609|nr:transmembrane protein 183 [Phlebotomus argentipes]
MSKKVKNKNKKYQAVSDFTINDCANAAVAVSGKKKESVECNSTKKLVELARKSVHEVHEVLEDDPEKLPEDCEEAKIEPPENTEEFFADYCIDIWWLISEHIMPEDILRFALICRKTACVVSMAKFWSDLYHRFYSLSAGLPAHLQPRQIGKQGNLRSSVIRSLFYTYPPFKMSLSQRANRDPACLVGEHLESAWFVQKPGEKRKWTFIYTFRPRSVKKTSKKRFPAENSHVLYISTRQFRPLPQFHGHDVFLKSLTRPLAAGFSELALKLTFEDYKRNIVQTITYDSGVCVQVIDWFSPLLESTVLKLCDFSAGDSTDNTFFDD